MELHDFAPRKFDLSRYIALAKSHAMPNMFHRREILRIE